MDKINKLYQYYSKCNLAILELNVRTEKIATLHTNGYFPEYQNKWISEIDKLEVIQQFIMSNQDKIEDYDGYILPFEKNGDHWITACFMVPSDYDRNNPYILISFQRVNEYASKQIEVQKTGQEGFFNVFLLNLNTCETVLVEGFGYAKRNHYFKNQMPYSQLIFIANQGLIYEEDVEYVNALLDIGVLRKRFEQGENEISVYYRRSTGLSFEWVRLVVHRSISYSVENPVVVFVVHDFHKDAMRSIALTFENQYRLLGLEKAEALPIQFVEEMLMIMKSFTDSYDAFLVVDLEHDTYLSYKIRNVFHNHLNVTENRFSKIMQTHLKDLVSEDTAELIGQFISIQNIKTELKDKNTMQMKYYDRLKRPKKCVITKIQSKEGMPEKVAMYALTDYEDMNLLKVRTFGNFQVLDKDGLMVRFEKKQSKEVFAYLIDKKGYPITLKDVILEILEKDARNLNAQKYASALLKKGMRDLEKAGYPNVIIQENHTYRINMEAVDCDYYHLVGGNAKYWIQYQNEYMKEYSWAEETNAELQHIFDR